MKSADYFCSNAAHRQTEWLKHKPTWSHNLRLGRGNKQIWQCLLLQNVLINWLIDWRVKYWPGDESRQTWADWPMMNASDAAAHQGRYYWHYRRHSAQRRTLIWDAALPNSVVRQSHNLKRRRTALNYGRITTNIHQMPPLYIQLSSPEHMPVKRCWAYSDVRNNINMSKCKFTRRYTMPKEWRLYGETETCKILFERSEVVIHSVAGCSWDNLCTSSGQSHRLRHRFTDSYKHSSKIVDSTKTV